MDGKQMFEAIPHTSLLSDIAKQHHPYKGSSMSIRATSEMSTSADSFEVGSGLCIGDLTRFGTKSIVFKCLKTEVEEDATVGMIKDAAADATKEATNAFELLMAKGRAFPKKKQSSKGMKDSLTRKDELFNQLLKKYFEKKKLSFPRSTADIEGRCVVQVLCNALWYLKNQHLTVNDAASRNGSVLPIPSVFDDYQGFNEVKRKRMKALPLDCNGLNSHTQALFNLLLKPVMKSSLMWKEAATDIKSLAECMEAYNKFLTVQNNKMSELHSLDHPVRTIAEDCLFVVCCCLNGPSTAEVILG